MTARLKYYFLCVMIFCMVNRAGAQLPYFRSIEVNKADQDIKVQVIIQDHHKVLWLGTNKGLYKYDGSAFKIAPQKDVKGEANVSALFCDSKGKIWVGLKKGLILTFNSDSLEIFSNEEGTPKETITGIAEDKQGNIWFATYGEGLYFLKEKKFTNLRKENGLVDDYVYCLTSDSKGRIWCGSDGGISLCVFKNGNAEIKNYTSADGLSDNIIKHLVWDNLGRLWFGTDNHGIGSLDAETGKIEIPQSSLNWSGSSVECLLPMERELWIGTNSGGLIDFEFAGEKRIRYFSGDDGFKYSTVQFLYRDDEGNIWIASKNHLLLSPGERIEFKKSVSKKPIANIHATMMDTKKRLWYSDESGLHRLVLNTDGTEHLDNIFVNGLNSPYKILTIFQDAFGFVWIGTFDQGIFRLDAETGNAFHINDNKRLKSESVLSITGKRSTLWLATLGGAIKLELGDDAVNLNCGIKIEYFNSSNGLNNNFIYQVLLDRSNRVWFAQDGKGISMFDKDGFHHFGVKDSVKAKTFFSITEDINGGLWFASADNGLYRYKQNKFYRYDLSNGLPSTHITSLCADYIGNVVVVCQEGIAIYNLDAETFSWYQESAGINGINADLNAISISNDGIIWIGASDQFISINTALDKFRKTPFLTLEKVTALLEPIDFTKYASIAADHNHLTFYFQGIWFNNPSEVTFQYKLEGRTLDWRTTLDRSVTFSDLDPGRYTFRLRCSRTNDFSRSEEINYSFVILNPIYRRWWFITFLILGLIALTYVGLKIRDRRVNFVQRLEKEKLASQFETLKNQVNPHFLFNSFNTLANIIEEDKDKAIEFIEKMTDFFRQILIYREKDLITLEEELDIIFDYIYLQEQRFGTALQTEIKISAHDASHHLIPPLALQLLIENAIKHNALTTSKPLLIQVYFENEFLTVKNNLQPKLNKEPSTGTGLENISRRMQMLGMPPVDLEQTEKFFIVKMKILSKK